jgi:hypothetical protein
MVKENDAFVVFFTLLTYCEIGFSFRVFLGSEKRAPSLFGVENLKLKMEAAGTYLPNYTASYPRRQNSC